MDLRIFTEPQQGATYDELLAVARATEDLGFDGFFRSDHYLAMGDVSGRPGPTDAWVTLAGLARETSRIRLGTLVTSATFRAPGPLAFAVAQVDQMSGGRVELGLGTGWFEEEHEAFGLPFPSLGERFERFEEQLRILTGLWTSDGPFDFDGKHYQLRDNPALARPTQSPLPLIIAGGGRRADRPVHRDRRHAVLPAGARPVRPGPRGAGGERGRSPAVGGACALRGTMRRRRRDMPSGVRRRRPAMTER